MDSFLLSVNNEKIWNFYNTRKDLSFEQVNLLFIDLMSSLLPNNADCITPKMSEQLVENIKNIQSQLVLVTETMKYNHNDNIIKIAVKLSEFKREYIDDVKMILNNNLSDNLAPLLREQNSIMIDKTQLLINEILPKNNEQFTKQLNASFQTLHTSITEDTNKFLNSTINPSNLTSFITSLEQKFSQSESRIESNIKEIRESNDKIRDISQSQNNMSLLLNNNVSEILKKMENSSSKGKFSENLVFSVLNKLFPNADVNSVGDKKETGDIMLSRGNNFSTILIENKTYNCNVPTTEVEKFERDVEIQNCCGLFLSQTSGITYKSNFEINIHKNNVLLYIHDVNYDSDKIKLGIEIIDMIKSTMCQDDAGKTDTIDKDTLDDINKEFHAVFSQKDNLKRIMKDFNQKMLIQIDDIKLPKLEKYLSTRYTSSIGKMVCDCGFIAKNQGSLASHKRGCVAEKNKVKSSIELTVVKEQNDNIINTIKKKKNVKDAN